MGFQENAFQDDAFEGAAEGGAPPDIDSSRMRLMMGVGRIVMIGWLIRLMFKIGDIEI